MKKKKSNVVVMEPEEMEQEGVGYEESEMGAMDPEYDAQEDIELINQAFGVPEESEGNETDKALRELLDKGEKELEETTTKVLDFVEGHLKPKMRHRDCYCVMKGKDKIVMAFIADEFSEKSLGQIFKVIGEARLSMDNATTLSASELFDRQQVEEPEPEKTLFDKLED